MMVNSDLPANASSSGSNGPIDSTSANKYEGSCIFGISNDDKVGGQTLKGFPPLCVTSDEINYLVYRYLQESGFVHTAFTFAYESLLGKSPVRNVDVPPGALISFLQKGLQYLGIEENLNEDGTEKQRKKRRVNKKAAAAAAAEEAAHAAAGDDENGGTTSSETSEFFSLLSPIACKALAKRDPPIRLNVPPASAAAAIKAKVEAEANVARVNQTSTVEAADAIGLGNISTGKRGASELDAVTSNIDMKKGGLSSEIEAQITAAQHRQHAISLLQQAQFQSLNIPSSLQQPNAAAAAAVAAMSQLHRGKNPAASPTVTQAGAPSQEKSKTTSKTSNSPNLDSTAGTPSSSFQSSATEPPPAPSSKGRHSQSPSKGSITSESKPKETSSKKGRKNKNSQAAALKAKAEAQEQQAQAAAAQVQAQAQVLVQAAQNTNSHPNAWALLDEAASRLEAKKAANAQDHQHVETNKEDEITENNAPANALALSAMNGQNQSAHLIHSLGVNMQTPFSNKMIHPLMKALGTGTGALADHAAAVLVAAHNANMNKPTNQLPIAAGPGNNIGRSPVEEPSGGHFMVNTKPTQLISPPNQEDDVDDSSTIASPSEVLELNKHTSEVFMCAWNHVHTNLIATGSGDASARIWCMSGPYAKSGYSSCRLLQHGSQGDRNKDVTTLEWSSDGEYLATGSYDGIARVWRRGGTILHTLRCHRGPIFSLKWNNKGNFLLSGSYDKSTIVWDVSGEVGYVKQQFSHHFAPALDVDWKDDHTFASCSTDRSVHVCRVGSQHPLKTYCGHSDEVNAVKWSPSGTLLASCSDDCTAKIWDMNSDRKEPLHDLKSHMQEIYTVKWSPTGPGSVNPTKPMMLATASFDGSVRLWNVHSGSCIRVLSRHRDSVYSVAFSPSGEYLASGSLAGQLYIWNLMEGRHVLSYKGKGDIFEVAWNNEETRVAACFSSNVVAVIDFKT